MKKFLLLLTLSSLLFAIIGCATVSPRREYVLPPPPERPRLKYLYELRSEADLYPEKTVPFSVLVSRFFLGDSGPPEIVLVQPYSVCADENRIYVTDVSLRKVIVFDLNLRKIGYIGGTGPAGLVNPIGLAVDNEGRLYVGDNGGCVIKVYDRNGGFLFQFGRLGTGPGEFGGPVGVAINRTRGMLYVADMGVNPRVEVFDLQGNFLFEVGKPGSQGELIWPVHVAVDGEGKIYAVDNFLRIVRVYDAMGKYLRTIGEPGDAPGYFSRPKGIAVDSEKNIYVSDVEMNLIQIFNQEGKLNFYYQGVPPKPFSFPNGLYFDDKDRLYVVDAYNNRVQVYQYLK